jgi:hypothetical protein
MLIGEEYNAVDMPARLEGTGRVFAVCIGATCLLRLHNGAVRAQQTSATCLRRTGEIRLSRADAGEPFACKGVNLALGTFMKAHPNQHDSREDCEPRIRP